MKMKVYRFVVEKKDGGPAYHAHSETVHDFDGRHPHDILSEMLVPHMKIGDSVNGAYLISMPDAKVVARYYPKSD